MVLETGLFGGRSVPGQVCRRLVARVDGRVRDLVGCAAGGVLDLLRSVRRSADRAAAGFLEGPPRLTRGVSRPSRELMCGATEATSTVPEPLVQRPETDTDKGKD